MACGQVTEDMMIPKFCEQPVDHFDTSNTRTWRQAYNVYDDFFSSPVHNGEPVPIMVGMMGEGAGQNATHILSHYNDAYEQQARRRGIVVMPIHRYYGCSDASACPFNVSKYNTSEYADSTLAIQRIPKEELQYLTAAQALKDTVNVIKKVKKDYGLTDANKVVVYGGSYPGMLAAFMRTQHPDVVHAAVANSAPVHATVEFPGFNDWVGKALAGNASKVSVGGSPEAFRKIKAGARAIETAWRMGGDQRAALKERFDLSNVADADVEATNELNYFAVASVNGSQLITADYVDVVQENDQMSIPMSSIASVVAETLRKTGDAIAPTLAVRKKMLGNLMDISKPSGDYWGNIASTFWVYQTCNEFGFIQTCDEGTDCPFPHLTTESSADFYIRNFCEKWGITREMLTANVAATNAKYGGRNPDGSCVFYVNGNVDPWHLASILESNNPLMPALVVDGASHHQWSTMVVDELLEPVALAEARFAVRRQVSEWLRADSPCGSQPHAELIV
eukprot:TRINITY_DN61751_c0_g1_i1.p1 TRINITY_DN61751_c0_g1~~TRINITY_DN61751_c0_g1_i1.p1  ORF type:complete len:543 (+),score=89.43 TRINITY_DN61751_c0_g1_i1:109-1629(+)